MANPLSWATTGIILEPSQAKKDVGFVQDEFPDYRNFNWLFNVLFENSGGNTIYPLTSGTIHENEYQIDLLKEKITELENRIIALENP